MIKTGDKLKLVKPIGMLNKSYVGREFRIISVKNDIIGIKASFGEGMISREDLEKYFEIIKEEVKEAPQTETKIINKDKTFIDKSKEFFKTILKK